jgi:5'-nucleotidase
LNILLTNDDGILAPGLWYLAERLAKQAKVTVVAPDREQSGVGTSVTLIEPLRASVVPTQVEGVDAYSVEGTPADCVALGLGVILDEEVDLVIAGINQGANLGDDVLISGTVGAALQGYLRGLPSLAFSLAGLQATNYEGPTRLASYLARRVEEGAFPRGVLLNINVPDLAPDELEGVEITRLASRNYSDKVEQSEDGRGRKYYWFVRGKVDWKVEPGTDVWALREKRVSVTPIHNDLTHHHRLAPLRRMGKELHQGLELCKDETIESQA